MIKIRTACRLHFGLLALPSAHTQPWPNPDGEPSLPRRQFGGAGLMVNHPGIAMIVARANAWQADGPLAQRALRFAQTFCANSTIADRFELRVESAAPAHVGLGVGTQLGLAVARAIAELAGHTPRDAVALALRVGRGLRSALGVHGFERGGFLLDGGKTQSDAIAPLLARHDFPEDWHILLVTPPQTIGTHGRREIDAFAELALLPPEDRITERLCRILVLGMLPALIERDLATFGEALYDYNRDVGAMFHTAQGGVYANAQVEDLIHTIRAFGVRGVGQSSWGPTVFAISDREHLERLRTGLISEGKASSEEVRTCQACNQGITAEL